MDLHGTDPAQGLITAGQDLDDLDRDLSDMSVRRVEGLDQSFGIVDEKKMTKKMQESRLLGGVWNEKISFIRQTSDYLQYTVDSILDDLDRDLSDISVRRVEGLDQSFGIVDEKKVTKKMQESHLLGGVWNEKICFIRRTRDCLQYAVDSILETSPASWEFDTLMAIPFMLSM